MTSPAAAPAPPAIADYVLLRLIGRGSYGDVWLAHGVTGVHRAVKLVWRARFADAQPYEREFNGLKEFARVSLEESRQLALLHVGRGEDFFYYVMELADDAATGREIEPARYVPHTLRETMARRGRLPAREVVALAADLARALAGLHTRGLVHRDIKPSNVIFVGGVPKLADIGLVATASAELTFVGTEGYVPPEGPGAPSADVFSLGKLLYELATGLDRHDYPRLPADLHTLSDRKELLELNEILIRACDPLAARRHPDAAALLDELQLLQAGRSMRRLRAAERHLGRALRIAAALAVIATVAGGGAWIEHRRAAEETNLRRAAETDRDALARKSIYGGRMAQAFTAVNEGDFGRARSLLADEIPDAGDPDLRGIEWAILSRQASGDRSTILRPHGSPIDRIVLSPAADLLAVHDESKVVTLYDAKSHQALRQIGQVQRLAGFSADGLWVTGTSTLPPSALQRWRVADGQPGNARTGATFRPLSTMDDNAIVAFEEYRSKSVPKDSLIRELSLVRWDFAHERELQRSPISGDGNPEGWKFFRGTAEAGYAVLACVRGQGNDARFRLTVVRLGDEPWTVHRDLDGFLPSAVGVLRDSATPRLWAIEGISGRELVFDLSHRTWQENKARLPVGTAFRAWQGGGQGTLLSFQEKIAVEESASPRKVIRGHATLVTALASRPDGGFFSAAADGELRWWPSDRAEKIATTRQCWNSHASVTSLVFSSDGQRIFAPEDGVNTCILETDTLRVTGVIGGMRRPIGLAGDSLWGVSTEGKSLVCWDGKDPSHVTETASGISSIVQTTQSPTGDIICFSRADGRLCLVDTKSRTIVRTLLLPGGAERLWSLRLDRTGTRLWGLGSGYIQCFDLTNERSVWKEQLETMASELNYDTNSERIYISLLNGMIEVRRAKDGRVQSRFRSGGASTEAMVATEDPFRLITVSSDSSVRVMDPEFQACYTTLAPQGAQLAQTAVLSPKNTALAILGKGGELRILKLR